MDAEQVNAVNRATPTRLPAGRNEPTPPPQNAVPEAPHPASNQDSVELSVEARRALGQGSETINPNPNREFDVTDNNQVILKIKDPETQKVIRQIPDEDQVRLRQAIQKVVRSQVEDI